MKSLFRSGNQSGQPWNWPNPFRHSSLDHAQLVLLSLMLAFAVFAFGGTEAWSQLVLCLLASFLGLSVLIRPLIDRHFSVPASWVWLPMGALISLHLAQLIQLPNGLTGWASPTRLAPYELMGAAEVPAPASLPLSVSTLSTSHSLRFAIMAAFCLLAVVSYLRTREHVEKLLMVVFGIGCAESLLALLQIFTGTDKLYWTIDPGDAGMMTAGSFVNHSHFSQFVNLAIGAGIGLLLIRLHRDQRSLQQNTDSWRLDSWDLVRRQNWLLAGLGLCVLAVCLSLSRNGILSLTIAAAFLGLLLSTTGKVSWHGWVISIAPLVAFGGLLLSGFDIFYDRLGTLQQTEVYRDRWQLTLDSFRAGTDYLMFGSGMGTYPLVFPEYDTTQSSSVAAYADNDYAQLFVEGGLAGYLVLILGIVALAYWAIKGLRKQRSSVNQAIYGLLAGFLAVAIHSISDFGQRLPAVFLLSVTLFGTLAALKRIRRPSQELQSAEPTRWRRPWVQTLVTTVIGGLAAVWMVHGALLHYQAESSWAVVQHEHQRLSNNNWVGNEKDYFDLLLAAENAVVWEPDDVTMQYWLNQYRWQAVLNVPTGITDPQETLAALQPIASQIADELTLLRENWPTYHPTYLLEGQLRGYFLDQPEVATALFHRGTDLAKSDPQAHFENGLWAIRTGDDTKALEELVTAVTISRTLYAEAATCLIDDLDNLEEAKLLADNNPNLLGVLLELLEQREAYSAAAGELQAELDQLIADRADQGNASGAELALMATKAMDAGDYERAIDLYRRALATDYNRFPWRLGLAEALRQLPDYEAARREVRICLRLRPTDHRARQLMEELALLVDGQQPQASSIESPVESSDSAD